MWYKNIVGGRFVGLVTKHACDRQTDGQTDGQNYDSIDGAIWFEAGLKLVADLQRAEIWPIIYLASSELARASRSATSFEPASNQVA